MDGLMAGTLHYQCAPGCDSAHAPGKSQQEPGIRPGRSSIVLSHAGHAARHDLQGEHSMSRIRKITAAVSAIALLGAGGLGAAQAATAAKSSSSTGRSAATGHKRGGGPM